MIAIIDYSMGNVGSIHRMLRKLRVESMLTRDPKEIESADKLILPGVGAFDAGMENLATNGLDEVLGRLVLEEKKYVLGICLGMQLLSNGSEEGTLNGLGWIDARTVRFRFDAKEQKLNIPHMGWNEVKPRNSDTLYQELDSEAGFYFVHSYHVVCNNEEDILATTFHGGEFVSSVQRGNIFGTQFHPEKSHRHGMTLLKQFVELKPVEC